VTDLEGDRRGYVLAEGQVKRVLPMDMWGWLAPKVDEEWTIDDGLDTTGEVVDSILCNLTWVMEESEQVFRT
jgi:hypothetical protein